MGLPTPPGTAPAERPVTRCRASVWKSGCRKSARRRLAACSPHHERHICELADGPRGCDPRRMSADPIDFVKVRFKVQRDDEGWPPVESEGLWAEPLGDDRYRVDNTPWFARNLAADDVVIAHAGSDGVLWATERAEWSGRLTIRVIPFRKGPLNGDRQAVLDAFEPLRVSGEGIEQYSIVALDVPSDADLASVKRLLREGEADGRWDYEESCVSDAWIEI